MSRIEEIKIPKLAESYYKSVLPTGHTVFVYPMAGKKSVHAEFCAKIGSINRELEIGKRKIKIPAGTAHFLEHKLFESGQGGNAFDLFAKTGANANAFTSFENTNYLFDTSINVEESIRTLLSFVSTPYFTEENVVKEMGIIAQEIKMYDDNPDWALSEGLLSCLYSSHPVRNDIAGTVKSISEITPQILYDCYDGFYRPSNMTLSVSGGIDPETVVSIAEKTLSGEGYEYSAAQPIHVKPIEKAEIRKREFRRKMAVAAPRFALGFKEQALSGEPDFIHKIMCVKIIVELIAGECSPLYRRLYDDGLLNGTFDAGELSVTGALSVSFSGESQDPERAVAEIRQEIERVKQEGFDPLRVEEVRRAYIGRTLCSFDSNSSVSSKMLFCHFQNLKLCDIISCNVQKQELDELVQGMFLDKNSAVAFIEPLR